MTKEQEVFGEEIIEIYDCGVNVILFPISQYDDIGKLLNDMTYKTIYAMMKLLDGYKNSDLRDEIKNKRTGCSIIQI